jgi:hypothetical protein
MSLHLSLSVNFECFDELSRKGVALRALIGCQLAMDRT